MSLLELFYTLHDVHMTSDENYSLIHLQFLRASDTKLT